MTITHITLDSIVSQSDEQVFSMVDGEVVLMNMEDGQYYGFDKILSRIWLMIETPIQVSHLIEQLMKDYDVDRMECETDVLQVLNDMLDDKLLLIQ